MTTFLHCFTFHPPKFRPRSFLQKRYDCKINDHLHFFQESKALLDGQLRPYLSHTALNGDLSEKPHIDQKRALSLHDIFTRSPVMESTGFLNIKVRILPSPSDWKFCNASVFSLKVPKLRCPRPKLFFRFQKLPCFCMVHKKCRISAW